MFSISAENIPSIRLNRYKLNDDKSKEDLIKNYLWNIRLSEAFYPALALFEVVLRNRIDFSISKNINPEWLTEENANNLLFDNEINSYRKACNKFKKEYTKGQLIAELNLGFWVGMFKNRYNTLIWDKPNVFDDAFPSFEGVSINRKKVVYSKIRKIHEIRNRISHHEPIFDEPSGLNNCYNDVELLLFWLSPETKSLLDKISRFSEIWNDRII